jgi:hypothetical protein
MELLFAPFFLIVVAVWVLGLVFWVWALVDAIKVPHDSHYRAGNKLVWVLVIIFTTVIGALIYLAIGRPPAHLRG